LVVTIREPPEEVSSVNSQMIAKPLCALVLIGSLFVQCAAADRKIGREAEPEESQVRRAVSPPGQPEKGPGSRDYPHARVDKHLEGEGEKGYWLFQPAKPIPKEAPVILFVHGSRAMNPRDYGGWIEHLVRRGNIVIYPVFSPASAWKEKREGNLLQLKRAIQGTKDAIAYLEQFGHIKLRLDKFAITGHSFGGGLTGQIAARAKASGLPEPKAVMPVQPGWKGKEEMDLAILAQVPSSALVLVVEADQDQFEDTRQGREMVRAMTGVPGDQKAFVVMQTDSNGDSTLISDHSAPLSPRDDYGVPFSRKTMRRRAMAAALTGMRDGETDALDYLGFWKFFDALCEAGFSGGKMDQVLGTEKEYAVGQWSDGTPVKPMKVIRKP
jgi:dienelactone hydrolase